MSSSAERVALHNLDAPPQCMVNGCPEDAKPEPALPEVLFCSEHWDKIRNLPYIRGRWEDHALMEKRYAEAVAKQKAQIQTNQASMDAARSAAKADPTKAANVVYYVRFEKHIKIGTARSLKKRMAAMSLHPDSILAVEPGDRVIEKQRHAMFGAERYQRSELFEPSERLLEHIDHVRSLFGDPKDFLHK